MDRINSNNQVSHKVKSPFKAYNGDEDYIFVSYKHKDADIVYPVIKQFHDLGFNIWYDEGLPYGENFDIVIPNKIEGAALFINFLTHECMACANNSEDYMVKESGIAQYLEVPILAIFLEPDVKLKGYYLTNFLNKQSIYRKEYGDNEDLFIETCIDAFMAKGIRPKPKNEKKVKGISKTIDGPFPAFNKYKIAEKSILDDGLTSKNLKDFDKLNTTTESIFELDGNDVLIILKDGTNLTNWEDVKSKENVIYISENLTGQVDLSRKYEGFKSLKAIVTSEISDDAEDMRMMFAGCASLTDIRGLECWDTSKVTKMNSMFKGCASLADVRCLEGWDTGNVRDMSWMFQDCTSLSDLTGLERWNTRNVTHLSGMFSGCTSLTDITGLESWDMTNAVKMNGMFSGCTSLEDISALESWNTSKVTKMNGMFSDCTSLEDITALESWDVSKVTRMYSMFSGCTSLTDISCLESWDTRQLKDMNGMFKNCRSIIDLSPLSNWDTAQANKSDIFANCKSAKAYPSWY